MDDVLAALDVAERLPRERAERPDGWLPGYVDALAWRWIHGWLGEPGPGAVWGRLRVPVVAGEEPTPLQRLAALADSANGAGAPLDIRSWLFVNTDLTLHLHRMPVGEWMAVDAGKCVGCRYCEWACPYGAPQFNPESGVMTKCNFCQDYLAEGKDPACVAACPSRVLKFGEIEDLRAEYGDEAGIEPLPDPSLTKPNLVIIPHRQAEHTGAGTGHVDNPEEI